MERAIPILPTEDLGTAKAFYVDRLGFRVTFEASEDGHSGLLGIARGTIEITLDSPRSGHGRNACVALQVDDADSYYQKWNSEVDVLRPPKDEEWGARTFELLDPSGNTLFVMGPLAGAKVGNPNSRSHPGRRQEMDPDSFQTVGNRSISSRNPFDVAAGCRSDH